MPDLRGGEVGHQTALRLLNLASRAHFPRHFSFLSTQAGRKYPGGDSRCSISVSDPDPHGMTDLDPDSRKRCGFRARILDADSDNADI